MAVAFARKQIGFCKRCQCDELVGQVSVIDGDTLALLRELRVYVADRSNRTAVQPR